MNVRLRPQALPQPQQGRCRFRPRRVRMRVEAAVSSPLHPALRRRKAHIAPGPCRNRRRIGESSGRRGRLPLVRQRAVRRQGARRAGQHRRQLFPAYGLMRAERAVGVALRDAFRRRGAKGGFRPCRDVGGVGERQRSRRRRIISNKSLANLASPQPNPTFSCRILLL